MIDRQGIRRVLRASGAEAVVMGVTFFATILFPLEFAVLSGVIFSLAMYVHRASTHRTQVEWEKMFTRHGVELERSARVPVLKLFIPVAGKICSR